MTDKEEPKPEEKPYMGFEGWDTCTTPKEEEELKQRVETSSG